MRNYANNANFLFREMQSHSIQGMDIPQNYNVAHSIYIRSSHVSGAFMYARRIQMYIYTYDEIPSISNSRRRLITNAALR